MKDSVKLPLLMRLSGWRVIDTGAISDQRFEKHAFWLVKEKRYITIGRLSSETLRNAFPR